MQLYSAIYDHSNHQILSKQPLCITFILIWSLLSVHIVVVVGGVLHVTDVQVRDGYVLHTGRVEEGHLKVGDHVTMTVSSEHR